MTQMPGRKRLLTKCSMWSRKIGRSIGRRIGKTLYQYPPALNARVQTHLLVQHHFFIPLRFGAVRAKRFLNISSSAADIICSRRAMAVEATMKAFLMLYTRCPPSVTKLNGGRYFGMGSLPVILQ